MRNLDAIAADLTKSLDDLDAAREDAFAKSRVVVRRSAEAIRGIHRGDDARDALAEARLAADALRGAIKGRPALEASGFADTAFQELVEAHLLHAVAQDKPLPTPKALRVGAAPYVLGLGDLVGEVRRMALDAIVAGRTDEAARRLAQMEELFTLLSRLDYPSAVVDVRRKQDAARGMLERTRGEVAMAVRAQALEERLAAARPPAKGRR